MNVWYWGDDHFLLSDNSNHLLSGKHAHGGAESTVYWDSKEKVARDDAEVMQIVKAYLKNII